MYNRPPEGDRLHRLSCTDSICFAPWVVNISFSPGAYWAGAYLCFWSRHSGDGTTTAGMSLLTENCTLRCFSSWLSGREGATGSERGCGRGFLKNLAERSRRLGPTKRTCPVTLLTGQVGTNSSGFTIVFSVSSSPAGLSATARHAEDDGG